MLFRSFNFLLCVLIEYNWIWYNLFLCPYFLLFRFIFILIVILILLIILILIPILILILIFIAILILLLILFNGPANEHFIYRFYYTNFMRVKETFLSSYYNFHFFFVIRYVDLYTGCFLYVLHCRVQFLFYTTVLFL